MNGKRLQRLVEIATALTPKGGDAQLRCFHTTFVLKKGKIVSISDATGAKFSLLPPDNATGNFVKVTQRVPVKIEIEDRGAGIPEDERHRIFDMFYTMERGDRGKFGTGLGLTIVKAIIGAHMGTIEAFSGRQNKGTLIQIKLPLHPVKE